MYPTSSKVEARAQVVEKKPSTIKKEFAPTSGQPVAKKRVGSPTPKKTTPKKRRT